MNVNKDNLERVVTALWSKVYKNRGYVAAYYGGTHVTLYDFEFNKVAEMEVDDEYAVQKGEVTQSVVENITGDLTLYPFMETADQMVANQIAEGSTTLDEY